MGGSSFDVITQEVLNQQRIMEQLEAENRELRRQLTDLREGRGVFIQIGQQRFALKVDAESNALRAVPMPTPVEHVQVEPVAITEIQTLFPDVADTPTTMIVEAEIKAAAEVQKRVTAPLVAEEEQEKEDTFTPTFLEEIMIDEFAAASTNKMAVWSGPVQKQTHPEITEEEQKAALRRELIGSFLLE